MDSEKLEMRQHILTVAARLLGESSLDKVRVSDVAEAAFVAAPTVYYHFGSLNRLMAEAQDLLYQQISAPLKESLALAELALSNGDAETFWNVIGSHLVAAWQSGERGQESGVVKVFTGVLASPDAKKKFDHMIDETFTRWAEMITRGKELGWVLESADTDALIAIFWSSSVGRAFLGGTNMRAVDAERVRDAFVQMVRADYSRRN